MNVPPFVLVEGLPGFDRLQGALAMAEKAAFAPEGFLCWLNGIRPAGAPEQSEMHLTPEAIADATEEAFRQRGGIGGAVEIPYQPCREPARMYPWFS